MSDSDDLARVRDYAWAYFELHARQRMSLFDFFLVLSALVLAGLGYSIQSSQKFAPVGVFLGLLLTLVAYLFWKLDQRVSVFLKLAEDALAELEAEFTLESAKLVTRERERTQELRKRKSKYSWPRHLTYGDSFRSVFRVMALVGVSGSLASLLAWVGIVCW